MTKIGVKILPREVILDVQGRSVGDVLQRKYTGSQIKDCKVGKWIELEFDASEEVALKSAQAMAQEILHNPLIEKFELKVLK